MKLPIRLVLVLAALLAAAGAGAATADELGDESTLAQSQFVVATTFRSLPPGSTYDVTWTAHFADESSYFLGGSFGGAVRADGIYTVTTDVADFVYYRHGVPLEYVRVCLRPRGSSVLAEMTGPDGHALCDNVPTGGYTDTYGSEYATPAPPAAAPAARRRR